MGLTVPQGFQVVIAVIGLILNLVVGSVVTFGLGFKGADLTVILLIALIDSSYYLINLLRMILLGIGYLNTGVVPNPGTSWWCPFDATMIMTTYVSCIEMVAILGFMRYLSICRKRNIKSIIWYSACAISYTTNLIFALIYTHNGYYRWSATGLVCIAAEDPNSVDTIFKSYYNFWFSNYFIRLLASLIIIAFSYFNVTSEYYEIISSSADIALKEQVTSSLKEVKNINHRSVQFFNTSVVDEYKARERMVNKQKWITAFKLCGAILAYAVCLIPDIILSILNLLPGGLEGAKVTLTTITVSNLLLSAYGIVSAIFVLLSHDPSRRYVSFKLERFANVIKGYFGY